MNNIIILFSKNQTSLFDMINTDGEFKFDSSNYAITKKIPITTSTLFFHNKNMD